MATGAIADLRLYLVTDYELATRADRTELAVVKAAIEGGVTAVQFRDKSRDGRILYETGRELRTFCREAGVAFIVNDRLDLALALEADGLHLGQSDLPVEVARRIAGDRLFIGLSVLDEQETLRALQEEADYLGASPVFTSSTKPDAGVGMGLTGLAKLTGLAGSLPVVGIGAINETNAAAVMQAGAAGIAVVSALVAAPDVKKAAQRLRDLVDSCL
ncbi:MAG TPA: thiamine phosphate synthase [Chloroflexia bacterium]|nr:thiamine phosphate synthase [Chloroflexia bacterium]